MDSARLKTSCIKAFGVISACFTVSIILYAAVNALSGMWIDPKVIMAIAVMNIVLWMITVFRIYIDSGRWARSKPYVIKNFIFMPLYLAVAMTFVAVVFGVGDILILVVAAVVFLAVFSVMQTIVYIRSRMATDRMNDALREYQKEHQGDEQE